MVEAAASLGVELIDMGKGGKRYKEELKTSDIYVCEGAVTSRSPLGQLHRAHIAPASGRRARSGPTRGLYEPADHLLKRYGAAHAAVSRRFGRAQPAGPPPAGAPPAGAQLPGEI